MTLDRSPDSLFSLWRWARPRLRWRTQDEGFAPDQLPLWVDPDAGMGVEQFSDDALWLIDAVARYWAVVWCEATGDRWMLHRSRIRGDVDRNRPVLERYRGSTITPVQVSAGRSLRRDPAASDRDLRSLFDQALVGIRG